MTDRSADDSLTALYRNRFSARELATKRLLWRVLVREFFQKYVPEDGVVVDLGAGSCEFINEVRAAERFAVDVNPATKTSAGPGVTVLLSRSDEMAALADASVDTVFTSNFFEHLETKSALLATLRECRRVLRPGGLVVVLMPNIRYLPGRYWDYLDHHLPLTHLSVAEALELEGLEVIESVARFLPYTVKDAKFTVHPAMVRWYLRVPLAWRFLGKQMLVVGQRP